MGVATCIAVLLLFKKYGTPKFLELDFMDPLSDDYTDYDED